MKRDEKEKKLRQLLTVYGPAMFYKMSVHFYYFSR